jgi:hypothetical protein
VNDPDDLTARIYRRCGEPAVHTRAQSRISTPVYVQFYAGDSVELDGLLTTSDPHITLPAAGVGRQIDRRDEFVFERRSGTYAAREKGELIRDGAELRVNLERLS